MLLEVQKYLQTRGFEDLVSDLGIVVKKHDSLPLVILNYDQIDSPKNHPVSRECRGLIIDANNLEIVGKSFNRFFNWGEIQEEAESFDFSDFVIEEKVDGSLCLFYNYNNQWYVNTRGSFAQDLMQFQSFSWEKGIVRALNLNNLKDLDSLLDPKLTYVGEFVSPWNKVVREYKVPEVFLLSIFEGVHEWPVSEIERHNQKLHGIFNRPQRFAYNSVDEIVDYLYGRSLSDPTFEGVVIRDKNNNRWKIKSLTYWELHQLKGNNLFNPKRLLPYVLKGEAEEIITYFPEVTDTLRKMDETIKTWKNEVDNLWKEVKSIVEQKDFALKVIKHPLSSFLFEARKTNINPSSLFLKREDFIMKVLKKHLNLKGGDE